VSLSGVLAASSRGGQRHRAMLPMHDSDQTLVAFIGWVAPHADARGPKYLNSPATSLFGLGPSRAALFQGARPVITKGPFDTIVVTTAAPSRYVGLAPCGTALTAHQFATLNAVVDPQTSGVLADLRSTGRLRPRRGRPPGHSQGLALAQPSHQPRQGSHPPARPRPAQLLHGQGPIFLAQILASRSCSLTDLAIDAEVARWDRWLEYSEGNFNALCPAATIIAALPADQIGGQVV